MTAKIKIAGYRNPALIFASALLSIALTGCGGVSQNINTVNNLPTPTPANVINTVPVTVGITASGGYPNGVFTFVTVCRPAILPVGQNPPSGPPPPPTCQTIPNILVDTGSVGLRLLETPTVDSLTLPMATDSNNNPLQECVQFADFSYVWGPVARATIEMADETAAQVPNPLNPNPANFVPETPGTGIPVQIITPPEFISTPVPANCLVSRPDGGAPIAANTLETLGANGILGVGSFPQDCGATCASTTPRNQYYSCPSNVCAAASVPQDLQLWNPVAAFAYDNNGLSLTLPSPAGGGSASLTGSLVFGIDTQSNNATGKAQIFAIDAYGNFPQVTLIDQSNPYLPPVPLFSYLSPQNGSYIDSGSPAIFFSDAQSLGIPECLDINGRPLGLYCPATVPQYSAKVYGANSALGIFSWNIQNAFDLLNSGNSVFGSLGGDSGIDVSTDCVDFGLPFFLGHTVFVGFAGTALAYPQANNPVTYTNGYWAF